MQIVKSSPYQNFVFALKSKDVKRQYPVMLSRFLNFIGSQGDSLEEKIFQNTKFPIIFNTIMNIFNQDL
jgi:hypothetical protein